jgi:hypothetical protein
MSTAIVSGGFPNLYRTDVSGAPFDKLADRAVARADVAELHAALTPAVEVEPEHHLINVAAKRALTATEFKQMFYARGDDHFELANVYECHNIASNILASVWGKRQVYSGTSSVTSAAVAFGTTAPVAAATGVPGGTSITLSATGPTYASGAPLAVGSKVRIWNSGGTTSTQTLTVGVLGVPGALQNVGAAGVVAVVTHVNGNVVTINLAFGAAEDGSPGTPAPIPDFKLALTGQVPYNTSRVINYNRLGGRPDDPSGVDMAYGYATDLQRTFFAQFEVMGNLEKDLCVKRDCWTLCSRMSIEDQLYGLAFVAEDCDDVCMRVSCARKWSEVEDALAESCLAENNTIGYGDIVDLYINVRVTNANPKAMDTIIRIRFPVKLTRGPDDLGNWNVVASDAADAVLTTGIPYDSIEGGNMQYANASQTEKQGNYQDQQQTQLPTSTAPGNSNNSTDPHDGVPLT